MEYKVYVREEMGYTLKCKGSIEKLFLVLDELIFEDSTDNRILVVRHDFVMDCDEPFYMYTGDEYDYIEFKNNNAPGNEKQLVKIGA